MYDEEENDDAIIEDNLNSAYHKHDEEYVDDFTHDKTSGTDLLKKFLTVFTQGSLKNEFYGHMIFHLILGQLVKNVPIYVSYNKRDIRINCFFVRPSGSGKSTAFPFIKRVCAGVGIPFYEMKGEVTEAALIGSYDEDRKGNVTRIKGLLEMFSEGGIFGWEETKFILESTKKQYNSGLLQYLITAMDSFHDGNNRIQKALKAGMKTNDIINFVPKESFLFVTFPIRVNILPLLNEGLFQRVFLNFSELSDEEWLELTEAIRGKIAEMQTIDKTKWQSIMNGFDSDIKDICQELKKIENFSKGVDRMIFTDPAEAKAQQFISAVDRVIRQLSGESKKTFNTFRGRLLVDVHKLAAHRALIDYRVAVTEDDMKYAGKLLLVMLRSLISYIEQTNDYSDSEPISIRRWKEFVKVRTSILKNVKYVGTGKIDYNSFVSSISKVFEISESTAKKTIDDWNQKGFIVHEYERLGGRSGTLSFVRL